MFSPRTPYSRSHINRASNRSSGSFLNSPKRSLASVTNSPRNHSLNRSLNTSVINETKQHSVLMYGSPTPVLVTEAITTAERVSDISVRLDQSGWATLVCGRRLFVWKYKQEPNVWNPTVYCRELILPPSDLAHKAELVRIFMNKDSQTLCALAVSPEGMVRFWPNIVHEASSIEATTDLQGQECHSLTTVHSLKYVLATTTGTLVSITISAIDGQHNVSCHTLREPQGVFAGIGRKVSSFIFGGLPTQNSEAKQLSKVLSLNANEHYLYVLSCCTIQKWCLSGIESDKLLFEHDLERFLKENFVKTLWAFNDSTQLNSLKFWCLDMQLTQNGILILTAAMNTLNSDFIHYAFIRFNNADSQMAINFSSFSVLKHCEVYQSNEEEKLLSYQFLYSPMNHIACIYSMEKAFLVPFSDENQEQDLLDTTRCGNILGAGICDDMPVFFAFDVGVLAIQFNSSVFINSNVSLVSSPQKEMLLKESAEESESSNTLISKLRSAMSLHFNNDTEKCQEVIREIFSDSSLQTSSNSELDKAVILLSTQIIDDYPISDPRWCKSVPKGDSVSSSLIILHQLDDKLKAHGYVISFFKAHEFFNKLSTIKIQNNTISTKMLLCEHEEKIIAAKSIRQFLVTYNEILDEVIKETLVSRNVELQNQLTYQDMFFREVSAIHALFPSLVSWEERKLTEDVDNVVSIIIKINIIFLGILQAILQYRQDKKNEFDIPDSKLSVPFQPWTSGEGPKGLRTILTQQISINMQYTLKVRDDVQFQGAVYQQYVDLVDILLDGYVFQLKSLEGTNGHLTLENQFKNERSNIIRPLLEISQYERAASLAEKYLDFDILIQVCEDTQNQERLQRYILQYNEHNFSDFMFKWYLDKGMRNKLLIHPFTQQDNLSRFLKGHDTLSWLHDISNRRFDSAQQTLKELANKESLFLSKKKTLCSLSKLAALASDLPSNVKSHQVEALNLELDLIAHQENLPDTIVEAFGLDVDSMRVLSPEELIEMYICEDNASANHYDFKIALELLQFLKIPSCEKQYEDLRRHIWCKSILRDNWNEMDTNNPVEAIRNTIFFQIIELAFDQGIDLHEFIMPVDDLLQCPELSELSDCPNFSFLLRAGYEYVLKLID